MLEKEHIGPRIAEVCYPAQATRAFQTAANQMHGLRRPGGDYHIDGMLFKIFFEETDRRPHPANARVGNEEVRTDPKREFLHRALVRAGIDGIDLAARSI